MDMMITNKGIKLLNFEPKNGMVVIWPNTVDKVISVYADSGS